ncbi:MAG: serine/threonine-protein kinase [Planctomycetota bacterium]
MSTVGSNRALSSRRNSKWAWLIGPAAISTILFGVLAWRMDHAMRRIIGTGLDAVLTANVNVTRSFLKQWERDARRLAETPKVRASALAVLLDDRAGVAATQDDVTQLTQRISDPADAIGYVLVSFSGEILASDHDEWLGGLLDLTARHRNQLRRQRRAIVLPSPPTDANSGDMSGQPSSLIHVLHALGERNDVAGAIGWCIDPGGRFSLGLTSAHSGESDESFAFDRRAWMVSRSRFEMRLRSAGWPLHEPALDHEEDGRVLRAQLRDIGGDRITASDHLDQFPLTYMADQATRGANGMELNGYRNAFGEVVIGAWRWLPEYELGVATEVSVAEAYAPIAIVWRAWWWLLLGTIASLIVAFVGGRRWIRQDAVTRRLDSDEPNRQLGNYELRQLLGVGGMGSVYLGRHQYLRRDVAIKVLEGMHLSPQSVKRFGREVQLTSRLRHPNTIAILDYGQAIGVAKGETPSSQSEHVFYYVMEYVDGISLQQLIDYYGPQSPSRVIHFLRQICGSISEAHQIGLIHRDIKPANILISAQEGSRDHLKVLDFGLVKTMDAGANETLFDANDTPTEPGRTPRSSRGLAHSVELTGAASLTGTPVYMAPETIRDATSASPQSDLYSIAAVGYALLAGCPTYEGRSAIDLCLKQLEGLPPRPEQRLGKPLPEPLQALLMQCLSIAPEQRPSSVAEFADQLDLLDTPDPWTSAESRFWWETVFDSAAKAAEVASDHPTFAGDTSSG